MQKRQWLGAAGIPKSSMSAGDNGLPDMLMLWHMQSPALASIKIERKISELVRRKWDISVDIRICEGRLFTRPKQFAKSILRMDSEANARA